MSFPSCDGEETEFERLEKQFFHLTRQVENLYASQPKCPGYPKWYSELCEKYKPDYFPNPSDLGTGKTIVPKVIIFHFIFKIHVFSRKEMIFHIFFENIIFPV